MYQPDDPNIANGVPLFACTKCNARHPFEELSIDHQLCKTCKNSHQMTKCHYCRTEFYLNSGGGKSRSICKKCDQLVKQHGKPKACAYCNIIAAFIGLKCQRCSNSEKKYGPPLTCENCKQKSAFNRNDPGSEKKVDGKLLCWLCTMSYKRSLAKARHKESLLKSSLSSSRHRTDEGDSISKHNSKSNGSSSSAVQKSSSGHHGNHHVDSPSSKKLRKDFPSSNSNGHFPSGTSFSDTRFLDSSSTDHALLVTQLRDQITSLNRKLQLKDKELLSKDQQIAELKADNTREQRDLREKISKLQRESEDKQNEMQIKLISLQKQYQSLTRAKKIQSQPEKIEIPSII